MKKIISVALILCMVLSVFTISASAASYTGYADDLKSLGLFLGTEKGFDLDRAPTRAEAAVMLVRMLGKEAEAKEKNFAHPFDDVAEWASPYIGYLYTNKLANGKSETKFGSTEVCNEVMYLTFVLRALGYSDTDGKDFKYADAQQFAAQIKLIPENIDLKNFMRDHCVFIMYNALSQKLNTTETTLFEKLVAEKAISAEAAKAFGEKGNLLAEVEKLTAILDGVTSIAYKMDGTIKMALDPSLTGGQQMITEIKMTTESATIVKDNKLESASTTSSTVMGMQTKSTQYIKDGYIYIDDGTNKTKIKYDTDISSAIELENSLANMDGMSDADIIDKVSKDVYNDGYVYTMSFKDEVLLDIMMLESVIGELGTDEQEMSITDFEYKIYTKKDGSIEKMGFSINMTIQGMPVSLDMTMTITAVGDAVKITYPDLTQFVEITAPVVPVE